MERDVSIVNREDGIDPKELEDYKLNRYGQISKTHLMTPCERYLSKLSDNHEIVEIGSTELELCHAAEEYNYNHYVFSGLTNFKVGYCIQLHVFGRPTTCTCTR